MKDCIYCDSSFIIASMVSNHLNHEKAVELIKNLKPTLLCISPLVIDEVIYGLRVYGFDKDNIRSELKKRISGINLLEILPIIIDNARIDSYLNLWVNTNLKPRDAMHIFIMKQNGIKNIATFDNDFLKNNKELGINVI